MAVLDLDNTLESCVGPAKCYTVYSALSCVFLETKEMVTATVVNTLGLY